MYEAMPIHFLVVMLEHQFNKIVEFHFESLQMDSRYRVWPRMHRLGIWINVNVYFLMWINSKGSIELLVVFLKHSK
jgi:hypothetical protein